MFHIKLKDNPGIGIFLEFWKAFDTREWKYRKPTLQANILNFEEKVWPNLRLRIQRAHTLRKDDYGD